MPQYDNPSAEQNKFKVKLTDPSSSSVNGSRSVVFDVSPDLSESSNVNYEVINLTHGPGQLFVFNNSSSRSFQLVAELVSRTPEEATRNVARLNLLRSWTKPVFGSSAQLTDQELSRVSPQFSSIGGNIRAAIKNGAISGGPSEVLGSPPRVLHLSAYGDVAHRGNLYKIPVVVSQLGTRYPNDVDYIPTGIVKGFEDITFGTPFPSVMNIDVTLNESHSPREFQKFNINAYRLGILEGF